MDVLCEEGLELIWRISDAQHTLFLSKLLLLLQAEFVLLVILCLWVIINVCRHATVASLL
jgi:hypothetical protein